MKEGSIFNSIELRIDHKTDMRGMYASKNIEKGETILFIPDHLIFTVEKGIETEIGQLMQMRDLVPGKNRLN